MSKQVDLSDLDLTTKANNGASFELINPINKEGTGIFISIIGKESDVFQKHSNEKINANLRRRSIISAVSKNVDIPTVEKNEAEEVENCVVCMTGWENILEDKKSIEFNSENATRVLTKYKWIREQVSAAILDITLFTKS